MVYDDSIRLSEVFRWFLMITSDFWRFFDDFGRLRDVI